ncbi:hypothetical protein HQ945_08445 [Phyllobacterium sp. BT25]|uniref:Uncharacterized protein n=1 Tax=Phyllobacterium pellucidum TaxID=2740464 RepID=A0A849VTV0_9HYPH|nr:hypothetical protein [Phyllobacterium pellucidum]NTS31283.1 hypothetical protein [Phyllobacterium pellucidum]
MACSSCEQRRRMLAEARKQGLKGVVKTAPSIVKHVIQNPPSLRKPNRNG